MELQRKRGRRPQKKDIVRYWEAAFSCDENSCMACGTQGDEGDSHSITRAHIEPHRGSGNFYCANVHLLCHRCHRQSEYFSGEAYDRWFSCQRQCKGLDLDLDEVLSLKSKFDPEHRSIKKSG